LTDRWLFTTTLTADEPFDEDFALSSVELELIYELIEIKDNKGIGLSFLGGYGFATRGAKQTRSNSVRSSSSAPASSC
jgi:hypothetical protein